MRNALFLAAAALFLYASCQKDETIVGVPSGTYTYTALDSNHAVVVTGQITINAQDSLNVTGSWRLRCAPGRTDLGPQSGMGTIGGRFYDTTLILNLNPGYVDNNVILVGEHRGNLYTGTWRWIGFPGELNHGSFTATR